MTPETAIQDVKTHFPEVTAEPVVFRGGHSLQVPAKSIAAIARFLKATCGFDMLVDLCGIDDLEAEPRFGIDYNLYSFAHRCRLRIRTAVAAAHPVLDSVTGVWSGADWHEREAFDMYGIQFAGHPNLKRILMWEGYPHHPLRKDFPLAGLPADLPATAVDAGRVETAPMAGGPFVPGQGTGNSLRREPRQHDTLMEQREKLTSPARGESV
ncbi:MAG: NADH-quinone oxidoreductase subunit C [Verrucomicrobia bacterium]|nr:NADH-quinone oxidoreductase subunit C [Verrucomicrobiota bacterium]